MCKVDYEYKITDNLVITNIKVFVNKANEMTNQIIELDKVIEFINSEIGTIYYFGNDMFLREDPMNDDVTKCFIDTGLRDTKNKPLFLALIREGDKFRGHYIMTINYIFHKYSLKYYVGNTSKLNDRQNEFYIIYNKNCADRTQKYIELDKENNNIFVLHEEDKISSVTKNVSDMIDTTGFNTIKGLDSHIKVIGSKIKFVIDNKLNAYYIQNELNDVIVNIGLRDRFGNSILLMYRYNSKYDTYYQEDVITSKEKALSYRFKKEQLSNLDLAPISFIIVDVNLGDISDDIEDYDLSYEALKHIIHDRRERFPEGSEVFTDRDLAMKIKTALIDGVEMCRIDKSYAKPIFSSKRGEMDWALPVKIFSKGEPELILIIRKSEDFYVVKTILQYDEQVKDRIISSSMYQSDW